MNSGKNLDGNMLRDSENFGNKNFEKRKRGSYWKGGGEDILRFAEHLLFTEVSK